MIINNVSSPFVVAGSDKDIQIELSWAWRFSCSILEFFGIAKRIRPKTSRIEVSELIECFIVIADDKDSVTRSIENNLHVMQEWDNETCAIYAAWKLALSDLSGKDRKRAKSALARFMGLSDSMYTWAF